MTSARVGVRLRPLRVEDAAAMAHVLADPVLYAYTGGEPPSVADLERRYAVQVRGGSADGTQQWWNRIVLLDGEPVGYVQATIPTAGGPAEVAWVVGTPWQGRGAATAAVRLFAAELADRGVEGLVAHIHPDNVASKRVAERLGLRPTATVLDGETRWATA